MLQGCAASFFKRLVFFVLIFQTWTEASRKVVLDGVPEVFEKL